VALSTNATLRRSEYVELHGSAIASCIFFVEPLEEELTVKVRLLPDSARLAGCKTMRVEKRRAS
jgi:hypothetical protein